MSGPGGYNCTTLFPEFTKCCLGFFCHCVHTEGNINVQDMIVIPQNLIENIHKVI
jgi:hypothetical protein